jgi:hypothetical protein
MLVGVVIILLVLAFPFFSWVTKDMEHNRHKPRR